MNPHLRAAPGREHESSYPVTPVTETASDTKDVVSFLSLVIFKY